MGKSFVREHLCESDVTLRPVSWLLEENRGAKKWAPWRPTRPQQEGCPALAEESPQLRNISHPKGLRLSAHRCWGAAAVPDG